MFNLESDGGRDAWRQTESHNDYSLSILLEHARVYYDMGGRLQACSQSAEYDYWDCGRGSHVATVIADFKGGVKRCLSVRSRPGMRLHIVYPVNVSSYSLAGFYKLAGSDEEGEKGMTEFTVSTGGKHAYTDSFREPTEKEFYLEGVSGKDLEFIIFTERPLGRDFCFDADPGKRIF